MKRLERAAHFLLRYIPFFLLISFVTTCCLILFLKQMQSAMDIEFTEQNLRKAASLTFANVLLLSVLFSVIDAVRRRYVIERPVRRIAEAAKRIMEGDFSVRIPPTNRMEAAEHLDEIIGCFNQMAEELSGVETLRTDFIANVSHELKTPLAVIQNYGAMLQQSELSRKNRLEYAAAITQASRRLADLISNILRLNRLENQQIYPQRERFDLGEQICECLLGFENTWEDRGIEIKTDIEDGVWIESDAELLSLVWNNLFSNAFKFTEVGGKVALTLRREDGWAVVSVRDTGCGIRPEVGKHIFEKFYQGDTSHATQGNGLGLALVKRVVDIVGGDISVQSEVGRGSTFTVKIRNTDNEAIQAEP